MILATGLAGLINQQINNNTNQSNNTNSASPSIQYGRITDIEYSFPNIGKVKVRINPGSIEVTATPLFPNLSMLPVEGEVVTLISGRSAYAGGDINPKNNKDKYFYFSSCNIWNQCANNILHGTPDENILPLSVTKNILPLEPSPGDVILQGRFGNSIRFGNTNKDYAGEWSNSGGKGNPITIIRNGQTPSSLTENIKKDLSSIYLTSNQQLSLFELSNENFKAYEGNEYTPKLPSLYTQPQIILNSNRIVLNAKEDSILISGNQSVSLSSNKTINIEAKETTIIGNIYLGNANTHNDPKNPLEPALLGDQTTILLRTLIRHVRNISKSLETLNMWPGGAPTINLPVQTATQMATEEFDKLLAKLNSDDITKTNKIQSNFVKLK